MIASLFSGGKDSLLAIHKMAEKGKFPNLLITIESENDFSYMFHKPAIKFTSLQAEALGIRQEFVKTKGIKEKELNDLRNALESLGVTELITGAIASTYQKSRIDRICNELGIVSHAPLWHMDQLDILKEVASLFNAIIVQVSAEGLDDSFLGKSINNELIERLVEVNKSKGINLAFEGGEAETFVLDAPLFKKRVEIKKWHKEWTGTVGRLIIDEAALEDK